MTSAEGPHSGQEVLGSCAGSAGIALLALAALVATVAPARAQTPCGTLQPGFFPSAVAVGGQVRSYHVTVGPQVNSREHPPLVLIFHGFGGSPRPLMTNLDPGRPGMEGAIVVGIEGAPRSYPGNGENSVMRDGWQTKAGELGDRDLALVDAIIARLQKTHCADPQNVYAVGFSNGGAFAQLLACERPDKISGIALVGSADPEIEGCKTDVSVLVAHGETDKLISLRQAGETFQSWAKRNACEGDLSPPGKGCKKLKGCKSSVSMCVHRGGHSWPGEVTPLVVEFLAAESLGTADGSGAAKHGR